MRTSRRVANVCDNRPVDFANLIQTVLIYALPVVLAITVHEAAHGYAARHFGDNTAYVMGRVTLNPFKHIDPVGTILMPLLLYFATSGAFLFGYAKPVPVQFGRLRNPKRDMVWVALAGPASNFAQAVLWAVLPAMQVRVDHSVAGPRKAPAAEAGANPRWRGLSRINRSCS